jgi:hypothetical protein
MLTFFKNRRARDYKLVDTRKHACTGRKIIKESFFFTINTTYIRSDNATLMGKVLHSLGYEQTWVIVVGV